MRVQGIVVYVTVIGTQKFTISARQLSSFIGKAMSTSPVTGKLPRIATRHSQITVAIVKHGETPIILGGYCKEEIYIFWQNNIHLSNFRNCFVFHKPLEATFSDASDTACGAVTYIKRGGHVGQKMWTQDLRGIYGGD